MATRHAVVLLPGIVLPAEPAFAALLRVLGERVDAVAKELEVYAADEPPPGYGLGLEVDGVLRVADAHGFGRFHLVGYSAGGAVSLAFASVYGDRLLSLALLEPAWAGNDRTPQEERVTQGLRALAPLPADEFMAGFHAPPARARASTHLRRPRVPPPAWMAKRPAGIRAFLDAFDKSDLDSGGAAGVRPAGLLRTRRPQQPRLLRLAWQSGWRRSFPDFTLRDVRRSATTSILRTASSPSTWPTRCSRSGSAPSSNGAGCTGGAEEHLALVYNPRINRLRSARRPAIWARSSQRRVLLGQVAREVLQRGALVFRITLLGVELDELTGLGAAR